MGWRKQTKRHWMILRYLHIQSHIQSDFGLQGSGIPTDKGPVMMGTWPFD